MNPTQLFYPISSSSNDIFYQIKSPILANVFKTDNKQLLLMLTNNYIVIFQSAFHNTPTYFCKLTFDVKSEFLFDNTANLGEQKHLDLKKPIGIKFEIQHSDQAITFYCQSATILESWMIQLEKKINQRNFHKLFKAKKKIGKGAFATVYLAQRLRDKKMVAVKAFSKQKQFAGEKGKQSLQNEITLMRKIDHPNIMKLQGVYETQNSIYVILQYLEGVQLNEILKNKKVLSPKQINQIIRNLLKGLEYLSDNRIIHRDLKPENIMFRNQNSTDTIICDFGLATFADAQKYLFVRCGTPGFVSPQIINIKDMSSKSDPISDVFSAGLIFHYLLFGTSIFLGKKYNQILSQNRVCDFNFQQAKYQSLNRDALDLLIKMLTKDPSKRISAKNALNHSYFKSGMEIEQQQEKKTMFKQLSNLSFYSGNTANKNIQTQQTPSFIPPTYFSNKISYNIANNGNNHYFRG